MYDSLSKLSYETTPLAQDHKNQEIASAQGPPPPYNPPPSSIPYAPTTTTVFVVPLEFNSKPAKVMCPYCNVSITTRVEHEAGTLTWTLTTSVRFVNVDWDVIIVHALQGS
uniref:LITAF domain-containing protein n=1 Tax=Acrobeloides nanus TaxID=290746 RepID=A0A914DQ43_9BILA